MQLAIREIVYTPQFLYLVLWTKEAVLPKSGVHNLHSLRVCARGNTYATGHSSIQQRIVDASEVRLVELTTPYMASGYAQWYDSVSSEV
jgi:hypothetical protein